MNDQCTRLWGNLKRVDVDTFFEQMFYLHGLSSLVVVGGNQPQALLSFILCFYLVIASASDL